MNCNDLIKKAKPEIDPKVVDDLYNEINQILLENGGITTAEFQKKIGEFRDNRLATLLRKERTKLLDFQKQKARDNFVFQEAFSDSPAEGYVAGMAGTTRLAEGGNKSVGRNMQFIKNKLANELQYTLKGKKLWELFVDGRLDKDIAIEIGELDIKGAVGKTKNPQAIEMAKIIHRFNDRMAEVRRLSGIDVGDVEGYISMQTHDAAKLLSFGKDKWIARIKEIGVDEAKMGENVDGALSEIFDKIVYGEVIKPEPEGEFLNVFGKSNYNNMKQKSRAIHLKDGEAWFNYNQEFGSKSLVESIFANIDRTSRDSAKAQYFGSNARAAFEGDKKRIAQKLKKENPDLYDKWKNSPYGERWADTVFNELDGLSSIPGKSLISKYAKNVRKINEMAGLAGAFLGAPNEWMSSALMTKSATGKNIFSAAFDPIGTYLKTLSKPEQQKWAKKLGIAMDDIFGDIYEQYGGARDADPGMLAKSHKLFFKYNPLSKHTYANKTATARMLALNFGEKADLDFTKLNKFEQSALKRYGVEPHEWNFVRELGVDDIDGSPHLTPEKISQVDDVKLKTFMGQYKIKGKPELYKLQLESKFVSMYSEAGDLATGTPGARERAFLTQGLKQDDGLRIGLDLLTQFKSYSVVMGNLMARIGKSDPDKKAKTFTDILKGKGDNMALAQFVIAMSAAGYVSYALKQIGQNKTPAPPDSKDGFLGAMSQSGAFGLYTDMIFGEHYKFGRSMTGGMLGPTIGKANELAAISSELAFGDKPVQDRAAKAARKAVLFAERQMPFQNAPFIRPAMDALFVDQMNELIQPGYKQKRAKALKERGQGKIVE